MTTTDDRDWRPDWSLLPAPAWMHGIPPAALEERYHDAGTRADLRALCTSLALETSALGAVVVAPVDELLLTLANAFPTSDGPNDRWPAALLAYFEARAFRTGTITAGGITSAPLDQIDPTSPFVCVAGARSTAVVLAVRVERAARHAAALLGR